MTQPGDTARRTAVQLMTAVTEDGRLMSEVLSDAVAKLEPSDRARAQRLATEGLRWAQRADRLLGPFLRNKPEDSVMNALRLALVEIHVDQAPAHAAVNAAVSIAGRAKGGMVNAVLRNVMRKGTEWDDLPVPTLPKWLRKPLIAAWGKDAVVAMEAVHAAGAPVDLTPANRDAAGLAARLDATALTTGSVRLTGSVQISALDGFAEGDWWVQDAAASLPAQALQAQPGERVLDMCAAPGGKTMQLASTGADVTAIDISETRTAVVAENLTRTGLKADVVVVDALEYDAPLFDAILLDAPCSATGTLRRHPDLAFAKTTDVVAPLVGIQAKLIDKAVALLKPGGRLVICTCSLLPSEGEEQHEATLQRHKSLSPAADLIDPIAQPEWQKGDATLRIRPDHWSDRGGLDGFHIAAYRKSADL